MLFHIHAYGATQINKKRQGCVILANHQSNIDPFVINIPLKRPIQYLVSDSNMRSAISRTLFWLLGGIPKTKSMNDFQAIRKARAVVRAGGMVGIFPEGLCSWDGDTIDAIESTAKLIKLLRVPVYHAHVHGSYFALPRWAHGVRCGAVRVAFQPLFTSQDIHSLPTDQLHARTQRALRSSAQALQQTYRYRYPQGRRAEHCEQFLFICPRCTQTSTLVSRRNTILCTACGALADLDPYYRLQSPSSERIEHRAATARPAAVAEHPAAVAEHREPPFPDLSQWNKWQQKWWRARLQAGSHAGLQAGSHAPPPPLLPEERVAVRTGYRQRALLLRGVFGLSLDAAGILTYRAIDARAKKTMRTSAADSTRFTETHSNIQEIEGCNVQNGEILEYYYRGTLYHVTIDSQHRNAYKWMLSVQFLKAAEVR